MGLIYSHIVFALKNSRYDWQKIKRKKPAGFIAPTYSFLIGKEEELLIEELCKTADEIDLNIHSFSFCGDHVHAIILHDSMAISKLMLLWTGKSAYSFNKRMLTGDKKVDDGSAGSKQEGLWAKSFYHKTIKSNEEYRNVKHYIENNRKKHGLSPLSEISAELIRYLLSKNKND